MANEKAKCGSCSKDFLILEKEIDFLEKKKIPRPVECPKCRQDKRLAMRNERNMYKRNCAKCQKEMISTYAPDSPYTVYCQSCFYEYIG